MKNQTNIKIYHCLNKTMENEYMQKLIKKIYSTETKIFLLFENKEQMLEMNNSLWTFAKDLFITHGTTNDEPEEGRYLMLSTEAEKIEKERDYIGIIGTKNYISEQIIQMQQKAILSNQTIITMCSDNNRSSHNAEETKKELQTQYKALTEISENKIQCNILNNEKWETIEI